MMYAPVFWLMIPHLEDKIHPEIGQGETTDLFLSPKL